MIGRKSVIGIAVLCALALSAFASASASAEQRAFLCQEVASGGTFKDAHCLEAGTGTKQFKHTEIKAGVATAITATNAATASSTTAASPAILAGTIAGLATEINCTTVSGTGELTNAAASVSGNGIITYTGCTVVKPAGRECKVKEGKVVTKKLTATTVGQAANKLKFVGEGEKQEFAGIVLEGCKENVPPAATYPVTGSLIATTSGATTTTTEAEITTQNTLKFGGNKAGLGGSLTLKSGTSGLALT